MDAVAVLDHPLIATPYDRDRSTRRAGCRRSERKRIRPQFDRPSSQPRESGVCVRMVDAWAAAGLRRPNLVAILLVLHGRRMPDAAPFVQRAYRQIWAWSPRRQPLFPQLRSRGPLDALVAPQAWGEADLDRPVETRQNLHGLLHVQRFEAVTPEPSIRQLNFQHKGPADADGRR